MLAAGRRRVGAAGLDERIRLVEGSAEQLPFDDGSFDGLTFTYLLRYVEDPAATLRELARVVRPGGTIASLEFGVPRGVWRPLWELYVRVGLPVAGRLISPGWHEVGRVPRAEHPRVLRALAARATARALARGGHRGRPRVRRLSLGGGFVDLGAAGVSGGAPARLLRARARRLARLRDAPAPAVHALAPLVRRDRRRARARISRRGASSRRSPPSSSPWASERTRSTSCKGHPLRTRISDRRRSSRWPRSRSPARWQSASTRRSSGRRGSCRSSPSARSSSARTTSSSSAGAFHSDVWFAVAWGAFPLLAAYLAAAERLSVEALLAAASQDSSASPSGTSRRRCGPCGAGSRAVAARSSCSTADASE